MTEAVHPKPSVLGAANPQCPIGSDLEEREPLLLPLETGPYCSSISQLDRDSDGWAPLPDAAAVRGPQWELLGARVEEERARPRNRRTRTYYEGLFQHLDDLREADLLTKDTGDYQQSQNKVAGVQFVYVSLAVNLAIFAVKAFAAVTSGSLVLLASALDSLLDLLSGSALSCMAVLMSRQNKYRYPVGKTRMEPLGVVVFATLMGSCSLQVVIESVKRLIAPEPVVFTTQVWTLLLAVIVSKCVLYFMGRRMLARLAESGASMATLEAQTDDHRNDCVTNTLSLIGAYFASASFAERVGLADATALEFIDPTAAILFSLYVMKNWGETARDQMTSLVGKAAEPELIRKITYMALTHCKEVRAVDTVRTFTFGPKYIAEVDVVLPPEMTMRIAHDIGESLQIRIEGLSEVERCYVHLDWETDHRPEHKSTV